MQVEFVFRDGPTGKHIFSRFVPMENWERAYEEYKVHAKGLGLHVFYFLPLSSFPIPMNENAGCL